MSPIEGVLFNINVQRRFYDRDPLKRDSGLSIAAQKHAEWMAKNRKLTHGDNLIKRVEEYSGEEWTSFAENIAYGHETAESVVSDWMRSSGHKKNILNKNTTHLGVGVAKDRYGIKYWCVIFGGLNGLFGQLQSLLEIAG